MQSDPPVIVWFRQDLRLADNPALDAAARSAHPVLPIYVLDDTAAGEWAIGGASRWWLHQSLTALDDALGGALRCFAGPAEVVVPSLGRQTGASAVHINQCVEPWRRERDARIGADLSARGVALERFGWPTLFDPARVLKADGTPYRVFTPFYRKGCLESAERPPEPIAAPQALRTCRPEQMQRRWRCGEAGAAERLDTFLDPGLRGYAEGRNGPDLPHVSRLSPYLHFGEISPNQVWYAVLARGNDRALADDVDAFLSELGWREFSSRSSTPVCASSGRPVTCIIASG